MASLHSLCVLCGSDDVRFLLVETMPDWLGSEKIRLQTGKYRVEGFCEKCVNLPQTAGGRIVRIEWQSNQS